MKSLKVLVALLVLALAVTGCASTESDEEKIAVVAGYLAASNDRDYEKAASYLAEDVVFETPTGNNTGLDSWWADIRSGNTGPDRQEPVDFSVNENVVTVESIVTFSDLRFPAILEVLVMDGKIHHFSVHEP